MEFIDTGKPYVMQSDKCGVQLRTTTVGDMSIIKRCGETPSAKIHRDHTTKEGMWGRRTKTEVAKDHSFTVPVDLKSLTPKGEDLFSSYHPRHSDWCSYQVAAKSLDQACNCGFWDVFPLRGRREANIVALDIDKVLAKEHIVRAQEAALLEEANAQAV